MIKTMWRILPRTLMPVLFVVLTLLSASLVAGFSAFSAHAHHPGSHAWRQAGTEKVKLEAVAMVTDGCTVIAETVAGVPAGLATPPDAFPIIVRLQRLPDVQACTMQAKAVKSMSDINVPKELRRLHVFVLKSDGTLQATERVPIN